MNWGRILIVIGLIALMGFGLYGLDQKRVYWQAQAQKSNHDFTDLQKEKQVLQASLDYYKEPQNLLKELKAQFNYREVGEKLIIIVPSASTTSSTAP